MVVYRALDIYEAYDRFVSGKKVREDVWDYVTVPNNALAMKEKYNINFDDRIIPEDEDLIDRLFLAGVEMLECTGFYNTNLGRVLEVTEEEIYEGVKKAPKRLRMGKGNERVACKARRGNSKRKPIIQGGPTGAPVSEDIFRNMMQSYAQEAAVDTLVSGIMSTANGRTVVTNTPWEIRATLSEIRNVRDACSMAGRPGMGI